MGISLLTILSYLYAEKSWLMECEKSPLTVRVSILSHRKFLSSSLYADTDYICAYIIFYMMINDMHRYIPEICKRTARAVLTGMRYSTGSVMRQGSSSLTWF